MHAGIKMMLQSYNCKSCFDYENALKEIVQEIALLGLWRSKFFEHAAFYGGSALRIVHGLDRFSEDLDFSLLHPDSSFELAPYLKAVQAELIAFGFTMTIEPRQKRIETPIQSAFIKANTRISFLSIEVPQKLIQKLHRTQVLKIKLDIDTDPPGNFKTKAQYRMLPIPFSILTYDLPDLFAGKMSAVVCRQWKEYVKGRDWYDMIWLTARKIPLRLSHLKERLIQNGSVDKDDTFTKEIALEKLYDRIEKTDFNAAVEDVRRFVPDPDSLMVWGKLFFFQVADKIEWTLE